MVDEPSWAEDTAMRDTIEVIDVDFVQPVGFVWFSKPRYRIKAKSRKRDPDAE
jgi:hypothetical protein